VVQESAHKKPCRLQAVLEFRISQPLRGQVACVHDLVAITDCSKYSSVASLLTLQAVGLSYVEMTVFWGSDTAGRTRLLKRACPRNRPSEYAPRIRQHPSHWEKVLGLD